MNQLNPNKELFSGNIAYNLVKSFFHTKWGKNFVRKVKFEFTINSAKESVSVLRTEGESLDFLFLLLKKEKNWICFLIFVI